MEQTGAGPSQLPLASVCIGRESELGELRSALDGARVGHGALVLLSGEPGIGKTCLARSVADGAEAAGFMLLWGNCWEGDGAPAFWPWTQIVRQYIDQEGLQVLPGELGPGAAELVRLVPGEAPALPTMSQSPPDLVPEHRRLRLFDAMAALWRRTSEQTPLMIVVDDLQWADVPSLLLLRYLVRELARTRVLVLGLFREAELGRGAERSQALADLLKESSLHVRLTGLDAERVAVLMESTAGEAPHRTVAASVHRRTKGNPFYVREFTRLLVAHDVFGEGDPSLIPDLGIPAGVREVVERRLARLSSDAVAVLSAAAVVGPEFTVDLLGHVTQLDPLALLGHLDEAVADRIVSESPVMPGRYEFAHELVRDALYDLQGAGRRVAAHRRVAEALESSADAAARAAEIAHHLFKATVGVDTDKAVHYAILAGDQALEVSAYEDAVFHYERALVATGSGDPRRCRLLLALGDARRRMGDTERARATFQEAAGLARRLGEPVLLARAALGASSGLGGWGVSARADERLIALLEEALAALGDDRPALRSRLLGRLAVELYWTDKVARRRALSEEALDLARHAGDPAAELLALYSRHWAALSPDTLDERIEAADELLELARRIGDREAAYLGHQFRATALVERGEMAAVAAEVEACERLAADLRMPLYRWQTAVFQVMGSMLAGRLDEAEGAIQEALATIADTDSEIAAQVFGGQMLVIRWLQGRIDEFEPAIHAYLDQVGPLPAWRAALAFAQVETGRLDAARVVFAELAAKEFADIAEDGLRLITIWALARVCAGLRDEARAAALYEVARPYAQLDVVAGPAAISLGSGSMPLALLAATLRRWDEAERHFRDAEARNEATGNRPLLAWTLLGHAEMLIERAGAGDDKSAGRLVERARSLVKGTPLAGLEDRASALAAALEQAPAEENVFRREGASWLVAFDGREARVKDSKGMRDLAHLLAVPNRDVHVLDLVTATGARTVRAGDARAAGLSPVRSPGGPAILDDRARDAYRQRIVDLEEELADAEANADDERAAKAREERDELVAQLAAAYGLGGRARQAGDPVERARKAVSWRIREAVRRIAEAHPELGRHLDRGVRTGVFCSYVPDRPTSWSTGA